MREHEFKKVFITSGGGFTLSEILVVIALLTVLIAVGVRIFFSNNLFYENQTGKIDSIRAAREAADRLGEYGRLAAAIESSYTYNSVNYSSGVSTVIFRVPSLDSNGAIIAGVYDFAIITASTTPAGSLELLVDASPGSSRPSRTLLLSNKVSSVAFTYDDPTPALAKNITYDLTITQTGRFPALERVRGSVTLRN